MELIEQFENEWVFHDPTITEIDEDFYDALEVAGGGDLRAAERMARDIVHRCPNHIDALHHLALWMGERGDTVSAYAFCQAAVSIGLHAIPPDFHWNRSRMEWGHLENGPFMRAYHALAIQRMEQLAWEAAILILSRLLAVNPNDNLGVRYELPACWLETDDTAAVIEHCRHHEDDASPFMVYSHVLAHGEVICADITYIPARGGFFYLVAVMDWASRFVLSWELDNTMEVGFCVSAVEEALRRYGAPLISNTDQGSRRPLAVGRSPATPTPDRCSGRVCGSAWTARGAGWTIDSSSGSGAR